MAIPITIGVTGHRNLRAEDKEKLKTVVREDLMQLQHKYPKSPLQMLNSLAEGGDTICAEVALDLGIPLICPLPFEPDEYRKDFSGEALATFDALLAKAADWFVAPDLEKAGRGDRDYCYREAGFYIAKHAQIVIALWDGSPAAKDGCGTAEVCDFLLRGESVFDSRSAAVWQIVTPRDGSEAPSDAFATRLLEAGENSVDATLKTVNKLNAHLKDADGIDAVYDRADVLATKQQKKYFSTLVWVAALCALLVFSFLVYDEIESNLFLFVYAAALIVTWLILRLEKKREIHRGFLRWRILAETLRTQLNLRMAGIRDVNTCDSYTWTQRADLLWLREAVASLLVRETPSESADDPVRTWLTDQRDYHKNAALKKGAVDAKNDRLASILTWITVALFFIVILLEFVFPQAMTAAARFPAWLQSFLLMHEEAILVRGFFKVALGVISTVTLFLRSYYGRLSLNRQIEDHEKMAKLYSLALESEEKDEAFYMALAREEIIENGNWLSYMKENRPGIDL